jgi:hypothetical protein
VSTRFDPNSESANERRGQGRAAEGDRYITAVLNLWPAEPDPGPRQAGLWRGAAAIALTGVAMILLLVAVVVQSGYRAVLLIWVGVGLPLVLLAAAAVRFAAGRNHRSSSRARPNHR